MLRIYLERGVILAVALQLAIGEFATQLTVLTLPGAVGVSANAVSFLLTGIVSAVLLVGEGDSRKVIPLVLILVFVLVVVVSSASDRLGHTQYVFLVTSAVIVSQLSLGPDNAEFARRSLLWASWFVIFVLVAQMLLGQVWITRGGSMAAVIALLIIIGLTRSTATGSRAASWSSLPLVLVIYYTSFGRMGFVATLVIGSLAVLLLIRGSLWWRILIIVAIWMVSVSAWLVHPTSRDRLVGGDRALSVGSIAVNTTGRMEALEIIIDGTGLGKGSTLFWGLGPGKAGEVLADAGFVLDTPHNEYVRLLVDFGLPGVLAFGLVVVLLVYLGWHTLGNHGRSDTFLVLGCVIALLGFGLTDNILSYSWALMPMALIVSMIHTTENSDMGVIRESKCS